MAVVVSPAHSLRRHLRRNSTFQGSKYANFWIEVLLGAVLQSGKADPKQIAEAQGVLSGRGFQRLCQLAGFEPGWLAGEIAKFQQYVSRGRRCYHPFRPRATSHKECSLCGGVHYALGLCFSHYKKARKAAQKVHTSSAS